MQVSDPVVHLIGAATAEIRSRDQGTIAGHLELGLECICQVGLAIAGGYRSPVVDQEHRDRSCSCRDLPPQSLAGYLAFDRMQLQPPRVRHIVHLHVGMACERHGQDGLPRVTLPDLDELALGVDEVLVGVVAPSDRHAERLDTLGDQETQAQRGREEGLLRCLAVFIGFLGKSARRRHFATIVIFVVIAALFYWGT